MKTGMAVIEMGMEMGVGTAMEMGMEMGMGMGMEMGMVKLVRCASEAFVFVRGASSSYSMCQKYMCPLEWDDNRI